MTISKKEMKLSKEIDLVSDRIQKSLDEIKTDLKEINKMLIKRGA